VKLQKASETSVGDFVSMYGAWYEVSSIKATFHNPPKLAFTFENGKTVIFNADDTLLLLDM
jgi:hypothetical protein